MARPFVSDAERRTYWVHVRMNAAELREAEKRAGARGVTVSEYMRSTLTDEPRPRTKRAKKVKACDS